MTYKELAEKLNKKYNTDVFFSKFDSEVEEGASISIRLPFGIVDIYVNVQTLEAEILCAFGEINLESLVGIAISGRLK